MYRSNSWPQFTLKKKHVRKTQKKRELLTGRKECLQCSQVGYNICSKGTCQCDCHCDLKVYKNDVIFYTKEDEGVYAELKVLENLGSGNFGQVYKCKVERQSNALLAKKEGYNKERFNSFGNNCNENAGVGFFQEDLESEESCESVAHEDFLPEYVAVKVLSNQSFSEVQATHEIQYLKKIKEEVDQSDCNTIVRYFGDLKWQEHRVLMFESLSISLLDLMQYQSKFQKKLTGLPMYLILEIVEQIVDALQVLSEMEPAIVHGDVKPENILIAVDYNLRDLKCLLHERPLSCIESWENNGGVGTDHVCSRRVNVKLVDFGCSCFSGNCVHSYFQTRWYRAPEVILGLEYDSGIDVWSLGCLVMEMFLGIPLFPGTSTQDMMQRIQHLLGSPPDWMLRKGTKVAELYSIDVASTSQGYRYKSESEIPYKYTLKSLHDDSQYQQDENKQVMNSENISNVNKQVMKCEKKKSYFDEESLHDLIVNWSYRPGPVKGDPCFSHTSFENFKRNEDEFIRIVMHDLCSGFLRLDPDKRWTPWQVKNKHPFIVFNHHNNIRDYEKLGIPFIAEPDPAKTLFASSRKASHSDSYYEDKKAVSLASGFTGMQCIHENTNMSSDARGGERIDKHMVIPVQQSSSYGVVHHQQYGMSPPLRVGPPLMYMKNAPFLPSAVYMNRAHGLGYQFSPYSHSLPVILSNSPVNPPGIMLTNTNFGSATTNVYHYNQVQRQHMQGHVVHRQPHFVNINDYDYKDPRVLENKRNSRY